MFHYVVKTRWLIYCVIQTNATENQLVKCDNALLKIIVKYVEYVHKCTNVYKFVQKDVQNMCK